FLLQPESTMRTSAWCLLLFGALLCGLVAVLLPTGGLGSAGLTRRLLPAYLRVHRLVAEFSRQLFGRSNKEGFAEKNAQNSCLYFLFDDTQLQRNRHLSILGTVFDVSESAFYKPGGEYEQFTGRDASRNFATSDTGAESGSFSDNLDGLSGAQLADLFEWQRFYFSKYKCVGYSRGRFYHPSLLETDYLRGMKAAADAHLARKSQLAENFPPCDATTIDGKTVVYCNGALNLDPNNVMPNTRYPRIFYNKFDATSGCACVLRDMRSDGRVAVYEACSPDALQCTVLRPPPPRD
uniref:Cytochrome b5 heme-binding domain-containing protein n=3 Tax=Macrostomum lignano TaxID=282301 RepID=A0A1I8HHE4_9PLAT